MFTCTIVSDNHDNRLRGPLAPTFRKWGPASGRGFCARSRGAQVLAGAVFPHSHSPVMTCAAHRPGVITEVPWTPPFSLKCPSRPHTLKQCPHRSRRCEVRPPGLDGGDIDKAKASSPPPPSGSQREGGRETPRPGSGGGRVGAAALTCQALSLAPSVC